MSSFRGSQWIFIFPCCFTEGDAGKTGQRQWDGLSVLVGELDGHSDLVTSVAVQGATLVSGRWVTYTAFKS